MTFPRFYTLWAINAPLDERRLCQQLDEMRAFGFDGAVFHPRFYPGKPEYLGDEYMAVLSRTILYARSIGMDFWIYDEDGWPSGTVGGQLLRAHPQDRQEWADLVHEAPTDADVLSSFEHDGTTSYIVRRQGPGVDYLNPELALHFLQMTHERYRLGLDHAAFEHISAFFCDEPEFGLGHAYDALSPHGSIPWTPQLPQRYQERYGEPISAALPGMFFDVEGHEQSRVRFWELITDLFCESFVRPLNSWCAAHGKRLAAHVKGEEHPLFQVPTHGSAQQVFRHLSLPGIDALGREMSNDFFPRQLASAARQFGDGRSMVECFGGAGWGATPDDLRRYLLWLGGHGITDFVVHLWQYRLNSHAIRDWPASIPNHIGWAGAFAQFLAKIKPEMNAAADRSGVDRADTLLVSPHRGVMANFAPVELLSMNIHDARTYADTSAGRINDRFMAIVDDLQKRGIAHHIADERTLESGVIEGDCLRICHCAYRRVLLSGDCLLSAAGEQLIDCLRRAGGIVGGPNVLGDAKPTGVSLLDESDAVVPTDPLRWLVAVPDNELPLEPAITINQGGWRAMFVCGSGVGGLSLVFADDVDEVTINGKALCPETIGEVTTAAIPDAALLSGENVVTFRSDLRIGDPQARPFAWVRGKFRVQGEGKLLDGPNGTVSIEGPFIVKPATNNLTADLTAAGYPFVRQTVRAVSMLDLPTATTFLRFVGTSADAANLEIDGQNCGLIWSPDWSVHLPHALEPGKHELVMTLYPSAFNAFGPHHHCDGDIHIVSPSQFEGKKNFADRVDAPAHTHVSGWSVRPLRFPPAFV